MLFSYKKNDRFREEFSDVLISLQEKLQHITVQERLPVNFALASLNFNLRASPPPTFPITHHWSYVSIPIYQSFNLRPMRTVEYFQYFQGVINILNNLRCRRQSHFQLPDAFESTSDFPPGGITKSYICLPCHPLCLSEQIRSRCNENERSVIYFY